MSIVEDTLNRLQETSWEPEMPHVGASGRAAKSTRDSEFEKSTLDYVLDKPTLDSGFENPARGSEYEEPSLDGEFEKPTRAGGYEPPSLDGEFEKPARGSGYEQLSLDSEFELPPPQLAESTMRTRRRREAWFIVGIGTVAAVSWGVAEYLSSSPWQVFSSSPPHASVDQASLDAPIPPAPDVVPTQTPEAVESPPPKQASSDEDIDEVEAKSGPVHTTPAKAPSIPRAEKPSGPAAGSLGKVVPPPEWVAEGRRLMSENNTSAAMEVWSRGLARLPTRSRPIVLGTYQDAQAAASNWLRVRDIDGVFVAPGNRKGLAQWHLYLISSVATREADMEIVRDRLSESGGGAGGKVAGGPLSPQAKSVTQTVPDSGAITKAGGAAQSTPVPDAYEPMARSVLAALDGGRYGEARLGGEQLARLYPNRTEPLIWQGRASLALGDTASAEKYLRLAADRASHLPEIALLLGISAQERQAHDEALRYFRRALELSPNQPPDVHFNIGYSHDALGQRKDAESAWRHFLDLSRGDSGYDTLRRHAEKRLNLPR